MRSFHQLPTKHRKPHFLVFDSEPADQQPLLTPPSPRIRKDLQRLLPKQYITPASSYAPHL